MKKIIAYIFVIVLLFSVLPVREIGKLLSKSQTTEEVHSDDCPGDDDGFCKIKKEIDPFTPIAPYEVVAAIKDFNNRVQVAIHRSSTLPDHFVPDIPCPPPDLS